MAYLITCSGSKVKPIEINPSTIFNLSNNFALIEYRKELLDITGIQLDWQKTLPAWHLYSGVRSRLYPRVSETNWNKPCIKINILSALFGWIKHTDLIPYYDLKMDQKIGQNNQFVWTIWNNFNVLNQLYNQTDVDLLSQVYRRAINHNGNPIARIPDFQFTDRGTQKGNWLNTQLNLIHC